MRLKVVNINKRRKKRNLNFTIKIFLFSVFIIFLIIFSLRGYYSYFKKRKEVKEAAIKLQNIEVENAVLYEEIKRVKSKEKIEQIARERGLVKPGEVSFRIINSKLKNTKNKF